MVLLFFLKCGCYCYGRQCSECDGSDDSEMSVDVDDDTPLSQGRQRRVVKEPTKFTPDKPSVGVNRQINE